MVKKVLLEVILCREKFYKLLYHMLIHWPTADGEANVHNVGPRISLKYAAFERL